MILPDSEIAEAGERFVVPCACMFGVECFQVKHNALIH